MMIILFINDTVLFLFQFLFYTAETWFNLLKNLTFVNTENNNYELFVNEEDKGWAYLPTESIVVMYVSLNKNIQSRGYITEQNIYF